MKNKRNYGIDLLRYVSMFFVIILHSLGQGGILANSLVNSLNYKVFWFIEIVCYVAVDIFAIISGYVFYSKNDKKFNYGNFALLWVQVIFYNLVITGIFNIIIPSEVSFSNYFISLFPIINNLYWYFTAYSGLFFLIPIIINGINSCSKQLLKKIFIIIILLFSIISVLFNNYELINGYSLIWLILLFIIGAIIKKCELGSKLKHYQIIIIVMLMYILTYLYKIYGVEIPVINVTNNLLINYTSPTILIASILFVIGFAKLEIKPKYYKLITFLSSSAFIIYIINNQYFIWSYVITDLFKRYANDSLFKVLLFVFGFTFLFTIVCILIDKIRIYIFNKLKVNFLVNKIMEFTNRILGIIVNKM